MNKRIDDLLTIMSDAARRQVAARLDAERAGVDSITGKRRYATYERQIERYNKAEAKLREMVARNE
jgi:hypothetical protein